MEPASDGLPVAADVRHLKRAIQEYDEVVLRSGNGREMGRWKRSDRARLVLDRREGVTTDGKHGIEEQQQQHVLAHEAAGGACDGGEGGG